MTIADFDEKGNLLGIELLDASKRIPKKSLKSMKKKLGFGDKINFFLFE